jgi:FeS assembly SUF system protein
MTPQDILKTEREIVAALKGVHDPEIPVNIYDLGLIYEIDFTPDGVARVVMTLTAPNCPVADSLVEDVRSAVAGVEGVRSVDLSLTFEPAWDRSMLSEEAKLELGLI